MSSGLVDIGLDRLFLAFDPLLNLMKRFKGDVAHPVGYFAPHKTEGVLFHNKKAEPKISKNLEMDGKVITLKREVKYLGVILNNRLK